MRHLNLLIYMRILRIVALQPLRQNSCCPREKRPEAFRSGAKEPVVRPHRGEFTDFLKRDSSQKSF